MKKDDIVYFEELDKLSQEAIVELFASMVENRNKKFHEPLAEGENYGKSSDLCTLQ